MDRTSDPADDHFGQVGVDVMDGLLSRRYFWCGDVVAVVGLVSWRCYRCCKVVGVVLVSSWWWFCRGSPDILV